MIDAKIVPIGFPARLSLFPGQIFNSRSESEQIPGFIANARDIFGNNALWYGLHSPTCISKAITEMYLSGHGCNSDAPNCLDPTYRSMIEAQDFLNSL